MVDISSIMFSFLPLIVDPSPPKNVTVDQINDTWMTLSWFYDENSEDSYFVITVRKVGRGEERNVPIEGSNQTANVTGLLPGTEYTFTVVAVSVSGDVEAFSAPSLPFNATTALSGKEIY